MKTRYGTVPWPHWVIDDFLPSDLFLEFVEHAALERQYEVDDGDAFGVRFAAFSDVRLAGEFISEEFVLLLRQLTGELCVPSEGSIQLRVSDESTPPFPIHVDAVSRRSFVMLFYVSPKWDEGRGGELLLHTGADSVPEAVVPPVPNRLVLFETSPDHWHSVAKVHAHVRRTVLMEWVVV